MMKVSQYFSGMGILGVILFVVGNVGSAWCIADLARRPTFESVSIGGIIPMLVFGFAGLISIPMMLIGREYDVKITQVPKELQRDGK